VGGEPVNTVVDGGESAGAVLDGPAQSAAALAAGQVLDTTSVDVLQGAQVPSVRDGENGSTIQDALATPSDTFPSEVGSLPTEHGEPPEVDARPINVTETLAASALIPEVRAAPSVWDADRVVTEIYHGEYKSLVRLAVLLVHDVPTAEEVVQDAFEAMHTAWRRLRDSEKALSYLRQAVVNKSRSVLRHRTVVDKNAPKPAPDEPSAEHGALALIERSAVVAALRMLPDRQREAIVLRYYADLSEADIAATMGISRGAVKSHTARAMAALKSILEQETL
jgi:RNA polymerase sigma-70 factor (sigma-E family)